MILLFQEIKVIFFSHLKHVLSLDYVSHLRIELHNMVFIVMVSATVSPLSVILLEFENCNVQLLAHHEYYPGDGCFAGIIRCIYFDFHGLLCIM